MMIVLPFPPSVNTYWRHPSTGKLAGRHLISEKGRNYRDAVAAAALVQTSAQQRHALHGKRLSVEIFVFSPDRRRRDLDNLPKGILDSLTHAGVWADDSDIDRLTIERCEVRKDGAVTVLIKPMEVN